MTTQRIDAVGELDGWLRQDFRALNTHLEETYYAAGTDALSSPDLDAAKLAVLHDGNRHVAAVALADAVPTDPDARYELLGMVGFVLAACRRHGVSELPGVRPEHFDATWRLAGHLGELAGVAPRYVTAHQFFHAGAVADDYRTFTNLADERAFTEGNGMGVLAYQRAADGLLRIASIGVSHPLTTYLLDGVLAALRDVLRFNQTVAATVDVDRFFLNVRPYFKPHRVGDAKYRGTNAGDFAAVNQIDLLLGLCRAEDPFYRRLLQEKQPYVPPEDQAALRHAGELPSLLERFTRETADALTPHLRANATRFLAVCRAHGAASTFHHHRLVKPYLQVPAGKLPPEALGDVTSSGPPLEVVVASLERLRDLRAAHDRPGLQTARGALDTLRHRLAV